MITFSAVILLITLVIIFRARRKTIERQLTKMERKELYGLDE